MLRIQRRMRETARGQPHDGLPVTPQDVGVFYVELADGQTSIFEIGLDEKGEFLQPWPDSFFEQDFFERFA